MLPSQQGNTTAIVQNYVAQLAELPDGAAQDVIVRELLGRAVGGGGGGAGGGDYILCAQPFFISGTRG